MAAVRNVALLIETSKAFGRGLLAGVSRYPRLQGRWTTYADERGLGDPVPAWLSSSSFDGIIVRAAERKTLDQVLAFGVPHGDFANAEEELAGHGQGSLWFCR